MKIKALCDFSLGGSKALKVKEEATVSEKEGRYFVALGLAVEVEETKKSRNQKKQQPRLTSEPVCK